MIQGSRRLLLVSMLATLCSAQAQNLPAAFSLTIGTRNPTVRLGSPIQVTITLENVSSGELGLNVVSPAERQFNVIVIDTKGVPLPLTEFGHAVRGDSGAGIGGNGGVGTIRPGWGMKPGEKRKVEILVNNSYEFKTPGQYDIRVEKTDPKSKAVVRSNTLTVTVTP